MYFFQKQKKTLIFPSKKKIFQLPLNVLRPEKEEETDLLLGEVEVGRDLDPSKATQVHVGAEFPFELQ